MLVNVSEWNYKRTLKACKTIFHLWCDCKNVRKKDDGGRDEVYKGNHFRLNKIYKNADKKKEDKDSW